MRHANTESPRAAARRQTLQRELARSLKRQAPGLWRALPRVARGEPVTYPEARTCAN
jgi:hypothetical protein